MSFYVSRDLSRSDNSVQRLDLQHGGSHDAEVLFVVRPPADLATGCLHEPAWLDEPGRRERHADLTEHHLADAPLQFGSNARLVATDLGDNRQLLAAGLLVEDTKRNAATRLHRRVKVDGVLHVVGVNVLAVDDQQVVRAAGDVELA